APRLPYRLSHLGDDDFRKLLPPLRVQLADAPHERGAVSDSRSSRPLAVCPVGAGDRVPQFVVRDRRVLLERLAGRGVDNCVHAHDFAPPSVGLKPTLRARVGTMMSPTAHVGGRRSSWRRCAGGSGAQSRGLGAGSCPRDNRHIATCPHCSALLLDGARFCSTCAAPVEPEPAVKERKLATVLFADLVGSTELGGSLDPEHTRDLLDRFYDAMAAEIALGGGTVEKFIGDAVVAVFGAPAAREDHAERALDAALSM